MPDLRDRLAAASRFHAAHPCADIYLAGVDAALAAVRDEDAHLARLVFALREIRDHGRTDEFPCHGFSGGQNCVYLMRERARAALSSLDAGGK